MPSDVKGFAVGLSLGLAALAGFGAANLQREETGRFHAAATGINGGETCFLVDTRTAQVLRHRNGDWTKIAESADSTSAK